MTGNRKRKWHYMVCWHMLALRALSVASSLGLRGYRHGSFPYLRLVDPESILPGTFYFCVRLLCVFLRWNNTVTGGLAGWTLLFIPR